MTVDDEELRDAMFLHAHPGWSWRDLQEAPARVIEHIRMIDREVAEAQRRKAASR